MRKIGSNINSAIDKVATNITNIATNTTDIATNTTDIATNTTNIAAIKQPETFDVTLNPSAVIATIFTFTAAPDIIFVRPQTTPGADIPMALLTASASTVRVAAAGVTLEYTLVGLDLKVRETSGALGSVDFIGAGWN